MKKFERIVGAIAVIALVMKHFHIAGASILMMLSFGVLSIFYYIFGAALFNDISLRFREIFDKNVFDEIVNFKKKSDAVTTFIEKLARLGLSVALLGILFKLLHLAGANAMLIAGTITLFIVTILSMVKYRETRSEVYVRMFIRTAIIGGLGLILFVLPLMGITFGNISENSVEAVIIEACNNQQNIKLEEVDSTFSEVKKLSEYEQTNFIPTLEHEINKENNSIYCATLLYAWDEIRKQIGLPFIISQEYKDLLLLNNSQSFINTLKNNEYSASVGVNGNLIIAKAEFNKSFSFATILNSYDKKLNFKKQAVASFGVNGYSSYEQLRIVKIVYYKNNNNFIIKLLPKDENHEIILFKTDKLFQSMAEMNAEVSKLSEIGKKEQKNERLKWKYDFLKEDEVIIPKINFNIKTNYANLEGKHFKTSKQDYKIQTAFQRTAFILDEKGAEIESEAVICVEKLAIDEEEQAKPQPKKMIFDKDFLILLKRTDAQNPYFGLWVVNTELMIK